MVSKAAEADLRIKPKPHEYGSTGSFVKKRLRPGEILIFEKLDKFGDIWMDTVLVFHLEKNKNVQVGIPLKTNWEIPFLIPIRVIPMAERVASRWLKGNAVRTELRELAKTHGKLVSRSKGRETYSFNNQNLVLTFSNKSYRPTSIEIDYAGLDDKGWRDLGFRYQDDEENVPLVTISLIDKKTGNGTKWTGPANAKIETTSTPPPIKKC